MGKIFSKWKKSKSTVEVLEELTKDIDSIERSRQSNVDKQKRIITSFILYSVIVYILGALLLYFYYMPKSWLWKIVYSLPLLIFPLLVMLIKKFLHWFFVKRIRKKEMELEALKERKQQILDEVMDKETYKKAKDILQRFDPDRFPTHEVELDKSSLPLTKSKDATEPTTEHRLRSKSSGTPSSNTTNQQQQQHYNQHQQRLTSTNSSYFDSTTSQPTHKQQQQFQTRFTQQPQFAIRPPYVRPFLKRDRTLMDRLMDYLLGDGPQNRYALICKQCHSHNGMALKEEFEYLSFKCSYCFAENSARKQKPTAPKLTAYIPESSDVNHDINFAASKAQIDEKESESTDDDDDKPPVKNNHNNFEINNTSPL